VRGLIFLQEKVVLLTKMFEAKRNLADVEPMKAYMKGHFPFLGIKSPVRKELEKEFFKETGLLKEPFSDEFVLTLWEKDEREYQYTALAYIEKSLNKLQQGDLALMETLITTKSWWDTVDAIAPKAVGKIAETFPEVVTETIDAWASHEYLWLRRAALLFQLKYKEKTNEVLLFNYIRKNADSKEFFIQKAIGWALREYSKTNPTSVQAFIEGQALAPLSVREGSKYLA
jgi:3-methyladenine DNA glycosylase AlkD